MLKYILIIITLFLILFNGISAENIYVNDSSKTIYKDTLDNIFSDKGILLKISYPYNWDFRNTLTETKDTNYKLIEINSGEIQGEYHLFLLITTEDLHYFNNNSLNETFTMEDSLISALKTPVSMNDLEHFSRYYYLFKEREALNNIIVFTQYDSEITMEKFSGIVENIIRKIKIIYKPGK